MVLNKVENEQFTAFEQILFWSDLIVVQISCVSHILSHSIMLYGILHMFACWRGQMTIGCVGHHA